MLKRLIQARQLVVPRRAPSIRLSVPLALLLVSMAPSIVVNAANPSPRVSIKSVLTSGQLVGTSITWHSTPTGIANAVYQFSVGLAGGPSRVVRDFSPTASFTWTPLQEGVYTIQATAKSGFAATKAVKAEARYTIRSRIKGSGAIVSPTGNPLVALYSAPPCTAGSVVVSYRAVSASTWQSTSAQPCAGSKSVNELVAGMLPQSRYLMRHTVSRGAYRTTSSTLSFTTGKVPAGLKVTSFSAKPSQAAKAKPASPIIFHALSPSFSRTLANPIATDLKGQLVWYYDTLHSDLSAIWPVHILSGGTALLLGLDSYRTTGDDVLREIDLAGNPVRETSIDAVNAQLARLRVEPIYMFHHDALRLPNGDTAVLGATQATIGGRHVMSDMLVVLDTSFKVVWSWDYFDHFTPPTKWQAGTTNCNITGRLCGLPDPKAVDWTHGNGIGWSSQDGNLILSFRDISAVIKIDYHNGKGTGKVLWRLGKDGNFTIHTSDPYPWFSLQHNATYVGPTTIVIFDDGNTRCQSGKVKGCESRGQVYALDEQRHVASLEVSANLGSFWQALGSAQELPNGSFFFAGGFAPPSREVEVSPAGAKVYELDSALAVYRAYRIAGMSF